MRERPGFRVYELGGGQARAWVRLVRAPCASAQGVNARQYASQRGSVGWGHSGSMMKLRPSEQLRRPRHVADMVSDEVIDASQCRLVGWGHNVSVMKLVALEPLHRHKHSALCIL